MAYDNYISHMNLSVQQIAVPIFFFKFLNYIKELKCFCRCFIIKTYSVGNSYINHRWSLAVDNVSKSLYSWKFFTYNN